MIYLEALLLTSRFSLFCLPWVAYTWLLRARKQQLRALWEPSHLKHACLKSRPEQSPPLWNLKQYPIGTRNGEMGFLEPPAGGVLYSTANDPETANDPSVEKATGFQGAVIDIWL